MKRRVLILLLIGLFCLNVRANELTDDYFDIAVNYFNSQNYSKALEYLDSVLKIEPDNFKANTLKNKILKDNLHYNGNKNIIMEGTAADEKAQEKN